MSDRSNQSPRRRFNIDQDHIACALRRARRTATRVRESRQAQADRIAEELNLQEEQQELPIMADNQADNQQDQDPQQPLPVMLSLANTMYLSSC